ncbi:hypothetical protein MTO96_019993 [Rhipicephalus appendiculatus]
MPRKVLLCPFFRGRLLYFKDGGMASYFLNQHALLLTPRTAIGLIKLGHDHAARYSVHTPRAWIYTTCLSKTSLTYPRNALTGQPVHCFNKWFEVDIGDGVLVDEGTLSRLRRDAKDSGSRLARGLLKVLFSPEELEGKSLYGSKSNARKNLPQKEALDAKRVNDILGFFRRCTFRSVEKRARSNAIQLSRIAAMQAFLEMVRSYPCLCKSDKFKDKELRANRWHIIGQKFAMTVSPQHVEGEHV